MTLPLAGGALIGAAAVLLYATLGRIAGVSGIAFGVTGSSGPERAWRLLFLAGLVAGAWLTVLAGVAIPVAGSATASAVILALGGGVLVGVGTRISGGCTSGHGVCGLARRSPRSVVAVAVFMAVGMLAATLLRPVLT
jgi:uncharacterized membrane protein YedE/YeeE